MKTGQLVHVKLVMPRKHAKHLEKNNSVTFEKIPEYGK